MTSAIAQQAYDTAEDIATIKYSELDIMERQLQSITMTLPSATSGRQEWQLGLIFGIEGKIAQRLKNNKIAKLKWTDGTSPNWQLPIIWR